jgi:hypothetical protein
MIHDCIFYTIHRCEFFNICKDAAVSSFTCNHNGSTYCGTFRELKAKQNETGR